MEFPRTSTSIYQGYPPPPIVKKWKLNGFAKIAGPTRKRSGGAQAPPSTPPSCAPDHWCKKIRSHLSCVAWSLLVTSATQDNLQDRHFDAPVLERFGTPPPPYLATDCIEISSMPDRRQFRSICSIGHSKNQDNDIRTKVVQSLLSHNLEWSTCQIEGFFSEKNSFRWPLHLRICVEAYPCSLGRRNVRNEWMNDIYSLEVKGGPGPYLICLKPDFTMAYSIHKASFSEENYGEWLYYMYRSEEVRTIYSQGSKIIVALLVCGTMKRRMSTSIHRTWW